MESAGILLAALLAAGTLLLHACGAQTVTAVYGENIVVPCNNGAPPPPDLMFIKWKYEKDDGTPGDLLVKQARSDQATVHATKSYAQRVSVDERLSLVITGASLRDQRTFTCMVVSVANILEYPVAVSVEKKPSSVQVLDKAEALRLKDKLSTVGTCVAAEAQPAAIITWMKNGKPLTADGKAVLITPSLKVDPSTGLSTTSSTLQVAATLNDSTSVFSCVSTHQQTPTVIELEPFPVHYPTEKILLILPKAPVVEGSNVTLKCQADGNPPPKSFNFHLKGKKVVVENADSYTLHSIGREDDGEYKCSLADDEKMESSQTLAVSYLDLRLSPSGRIVKKVGDSLSVTAEKNSSADADVLWTKNGVTVTEPQFTKLAYADAGLYTCQASMTGLARSQSFELVVEGKPVITSLTKHEDEDAKHKVLTCEAEGVPEPSFLWNINTTNEETTHRNGKTVRQVSVVPRLNLTVTCSVSNRLGDDVMSINVSSVFKEQTEGRESSEDSEDQSKLITGLVVGLLLVAAIAGLIYWLYMRNSRQGSWKTGEKETGTSEESKKLEDNHLAV